MSAVLWSGCPRRLQTVLLHPGRRAVNEMQCRFNNANNHPKYFRSRHSIMYDLAPKDRALQAILSDRGHGSWPDAVNKMKKGLVAVNGKIVKNKKKCSTDAHIEINGEVVEPVPMLAIYHKPVGVQCTTEDPWGRESLKELLPRWPFLQSMHPVGRLDTDTSGLLLFSRSGFATKALLEPATALEREYKAIVIGAVNPKELREKLTSGVVTAEGTFSGVLKHHEHIIGAERLEEVKRGMKAIETPRVTKILQKKQQRNGQPQLGPTELKVAISEYLAKDPYYEKATEIRVVVTEGKHRMVRRMLHNAGHTVVFLHRLRYGGIELDELKENSVRPISSNELKWFTQWATEYDVKVKETMERQYELEQAGKRVLKNEAKDAKAFVREQATQILDRMRKARKSTLKKKGLLWPENVVEKAEGEEHEEVVIKESEARANEVKKLVAEKLAEYAAGREEPLSNRALKQATKAINKVILTDKKEEKKWVRLRKKKLLKEERERKQMEINFHKKPSLYYS